MNSITSQLILELQQADNKDSRRFRELVCNCVEVLNFTPHDLARKFGFSVPGAKRWMLGTCSPHPIMRGAIYRSFIKLLEDHEAARIKRY